MAAVTRYQRWTHGSPVMLVHAATAPRTELAVDNHDEHDTKFVEVAAESHHRGNAAALSAGTRAAELITPNW